MMTRRWWRPIGQCVGPFLGLVLAAGLAQSAYSESVTPQKSDTDPNSYRYVRLDNGLKVLLVGNERLQEAAVSLDVKAGYYQDPEFRQGLANLVKNTWTAHIEALLNEKGKEGKKAEQSEKDEKDEKRENQALGEQRKLDKQSGRLAAGLSEQHTYYRLTVEPDRLPSVLKRLSAALASPQFKTETIQRGLKALEAELGSSLEGAERRLADVHRELIRQDHPASRIKTGRGESGIDADEGELSKSVISFFNRWYRLERMGLVVMGPSRLDDLEKQVSEAFGSLAERQPTSEKPLTEHPPLFPKNFLPAQVNLPSPAGKRRLFLSFPVPGLDPRNRSLAYISHLLAYPGEGSLLSLLKALGWGNHVETRVRWDTEQDALFEVSVELTALGVRASDQIVALVFDRLRDMRKEGLAPWRYKELARLSELHFRFPEEPSSLDRVSEWAHRLHYFDPALLLVGPELYEPFNESQIKEYLGKLRSDRVLVSLMAPNLETERRTKYFKTPYRVFKLKAEQPEIKLKVKKRLYFPKENHFIPSRIRLKKRPVLPPPGGGGNAQPGAPQLIVNQARTRVWFAQDRRFGSPKGSLNLRLKLPLVAADLEGAARAQLFAALVRDQLAALEHPARLAGLSFSVEATARGLDIRVFGYTSRQSLLLSKILERVQKGRFQASRFEAVKTELLKRWDQEPSDKVAALTHQVPRLLHAPAWSGEDMSRVIRLENRKGLHRFADKLLQNAQIDALFYGNLYRQEAMRLAAMVEHQLRSNPTRRGLLPAQTFFLPTDRPAFFYHPQSGGRPLSVLYVQGLETSPEDAAHMRLLQSMMEAELELTATDKGVTQAELLALPIRDLAGTALVLSSAEKGEREPVGFVNGFLANFRAQIGQNLDAYRHKLEKRLREPADHLHQQAERHWQSIILDGVPQRRARLAQAVSQITSESLESYFDAVFLNPNRRLWLSNVGERLPEQAQRIQSIAAFREALDSKRYP